MDGRGEGEGDADVRIEIVRIQERLKQTALREEMHIADTRILQEVSNIFDRTSTGHKEFVRDRVRESALEIKGEMQGLQSAVASLTAALTERPEKKGFGGPLAYTGGVTTGGAAVYLLLQLLGQLQHGGG